MDPSRYWGNLPREQMADIVDHAERHGFEDACRHVIPEYVQAHLKTPGRDDGRFFLPIGPTARVLDLGCMWGALTLSLARYAGQVVGIDQTREVLELAAIRGRDQNLNNLIFLGGEATRLPVDDKQFDVVILNGVLEWIGLEDPYVCEIHWGKKQAITDSASRSPRELQVACLKEVFRVLKPGGTLYLAIENRYSFMYFAGRPDDHSGLRFNSLMPRAVADRYSRMRLGQPYRAYTYSRAGLAALLSEAGLRHVGTHTGMNSYAEPLAIFPLTTPMLRYYYDNHWVDRFPPFRHRFFRLIYLLLLASGLARITPHAFILTARRPGTTDADADLTLESLLGKHWEMLYPGMAKPRSLGIMKIDGRQEEAAPVSFIVFSNGRPFAPIGYVKLARNTLCRANLAREAKIYRDISMRQDTALLPRQFFAGQKGQYYIVTRPFVGGKKFKFPNRGDRRLDGRRSQSLNRYLSSAVSWLCALFATSDPQSISFDRFYDDFVIKRLAAFSGVFPTETLPPELLSAYRQRLAQVAPASIPLGMLHGDFNCYNLLMTGNRLHVVDFEYGESRSFPVFDFLNLCLQTIIDITQPSLAPFLSGPVDTPHCTARPSAKFFGPIVDFIRSGEAHTTRLLYPHLASYCRSMGLKPEFILRAAPVFILDLLHREYGDHEFHLRSRPLFRHLVSEVSRGDRHRAGEVNDAP